MKRGIRGGAIRYAYDALSLITSDGAYANLALKKSLVDADRETAARASAMLYTTLENISYADHFVDLYAKTRVHGSVRNVLRISITRMLIMKTPVHAAVNEGTELVRSIGKTGISGFVNAVLRSIARDIEENSLPPLPTDPAERLTVRYGLPKGIAEEYVGSYGVEFAEKLASTRLHKTTVRAQYPTGTEELEGELSALGIDSERGRYDGNALILKGGGSPAALDAFREGRLAVQSESSMLVCRAMKVREGMSILDACAAPGGKTAYLAGLMKNTGSITAWDKHPHRVELTKLNLERLGVANCTVEVRDAASAEAEGEYDAVLVDAPCSGLGGGSKPDALLRRTDEDIDALAALQQRILENAAKFVKSGGALIYSTCTVSKRENEKNIAAFLEKHAEFCEEELSFLVEACEDASGGDDENERESPPKAAHGLQLFCPVHGVDGFYIARLVKRGGK